MAVLRYRPLNLGRWLLWGATAALFVLAPLVFTHGFALTMMTQMGTFIIFALSYNMLLGQGGMLSFGHAVYSGLGAYFTVHALNLIGKGALAFPVMLLPLVGGLAGLVFGVVFGYVTTRRAGTTFAMISLGIGELVHACVLMFPGFFGGEGGISTNRMVGKPFLGITFGPAIQVYYLVAAWCFACMVAMFALTQTPLGRMANAVRDNPERAEFVGYDTQKVRFLQLVLSAFFAGVSGALSCINFEIVTDENVSALRSGGVLLATFIGGTGFFFGPIVGSVVFVFFVVALSGFTQAWLLYLGLFFLAMVLYAPGGIASLVAMQLPVIRARRFGELALPYLLALAAGLVAFAGLVGAVEMVYRISDASLDTHMSLFGVGFDARSPRPWTAFGALLAAGLVALGFAARRVGERWGAIQGELQGNRA
ncbi:MAG: branched-chain amino acid ABC transporter permease [Betaproteobacteria bacterium]|nr:branched-chain amino acid ABC transporter permease [Betaproteobacteria bacterium]